MKTNNLLLALVVSATLAACSSYGTRSAAPAVVSGDMLVGANGMTLYTFDADKAGSGKSACNGPCAGLWPPLLAADQPSGEYSVVTRDDGARQVAYKGKPVYFYKADQKAGDRTGDNFKDVWHIIKE